MKHCQKVLDDISSYTCRWSALSREEVLSFEVKTRAAKTTVVNCDDFSLRDILYHSPVTPTIVKGLPTAMPYIVDCPTRWSLWYWYLDFCVDHLFRYPDDLRNIVQQCATFPQANWSKKWQFLQFSRKTDHMSHPGKLQKVSVFAPVGLWKRCYLNFPKTYVLDSNGFH